MSFFQQLAALWQDAKETTQSSDNFKYVIRMRNGTYWSNEQGGRWLPEKKGRAPGKALHIKGADKAFDYVEAHLWEFADDVDVVIP